MLEEGPASLTETTTIRQDQKLALQCHLDYNTFIIWFVAHSAVRQLEQKRRLTLNKVHRLTNRSITLHKAED